LQAQPDVAGSPIRYSERVNRRIRQDGIDTLGISTQTLFEEAVRKDEKEVAVDLLEYFWNEMFIMAEALFTWLGDIFAYRARRWGAADNAENIAGLLGGLRGFDPSSGDRARAKTAVLEGNQDEAIAACELMRVRYASLKDGLVVWIQELLSDLSTEFGEDAVLESVEAAYENLWKHRYAPWEDMAPLERVQLSVEGIRGHLAGKRRRGDLTIVDEGDRYALVLDPCGTCGVLRRGDPDSGRPPYNPTGSRSGHPWTWNRIGLSWYTVHNPIVLEYLQMSRGRPPIRPLEDCDQDTPCRWIVYKDFRAARADHYTRMGFEPPKEAQAVS
jgi:hypothetical protein